MKSVLLAGLLLASAAPAGAVLKLALGPDAMDEIPAGFIRFSFLNDLILGGSTFRNVLSPFPDVACTGGVTVTDAADTSLKLATVDDFGSRELLALETLSAGGERARIAAVDDGSGITAHRLTVMPAVDQQEVVCVIRDTLFGSGFED